MHLFLTRNRLVTLLMVFGITLLAGTVVRRIGLLHGAPNMVWHPDVAKQLWVARKFHTGKLDLRAMYKDDVELTLYPYGTAVLVSPLITTLERLEGIDLRVWNNWHLDRAMRYLSSGMMIGSIAIALCILYPLCGPLNTLLIGLLLSLEPLNVQLSHYAMNDVPMTSLVLIVWLAASRIPSEPARAPWISALVGLLIGLGFGVKYQAILCGAFPLVAWIFAWRQKHWTGVLLSACVCALATMLGVLITTPMFVEDPSYFIDQFPKFMQWQANITEIEIPLAKKIERNISALVKMFFQNGFWLLLPIILMSPLPFFWRRFSSTAKILSLSGGIFAGLLCAALIVSRDYVRVNDVLPLRSIFIVVAGLTLTHLLNSSARLLFRGIIFAAILWFTHVSLQDSLALRRPDTRLLARDWCLQNISAGSVVRREAYTLPVDKKGVIDRGYETFADFDVPRILKEAKDDYLITSSLAHARWFDEHLPHRDEESQTIYAWIRDTHEVVAEFHDRRLLHAHPDLVIYRKRQSQEEKHE